MILVPTTTAVAQQEEAPRAIVDSIVVQGNSRISRRQIVSQSGLPLRSQISFRDIQRAISSLYALGEFEDVSISSANVNGRELLLVSVEERPLLTAWNVTGTERLSERSVRGRVELSSGRPYNRADAAVSVARIDSLYRNEGYHSTEIEIREQPQTDGSMRVLFEIREGSRVAISEIVIEGNEHFTDEQIAGAMSTGTEGFWWFQRGEYDELKLQTDLRQRLPGFYADRGYLDFRALDDSLDVNRNTGKGTLIVRVEEGEQYEVGTFEVLGNRQYTTQQIEAFYPFGEQITGFLGLGGTRDGPAIFDQSAWDGALSSVQGLYYNNGYIWAQVIPNMRKRVTAEGKRVVDLRWQVFEGQPAIVSRVDIEGNTVTHENVIRRAIEMIPGDVFRQRAMIRSYQNISNLNYFVQPMPQPDFQDDPSRGEVSVTFRVEERNTGNINFGASVGQGTGIGGFIGLQQPNLFGRGKNASFQWQFGRNVSDFNVSYSDPSIRGGLISGSISLHNTRLRYTVGELGRITTRGGRLQVGFPLFGSRYTRVFPNYTLEQQNLESETLDNRFACDNCVLSSLGVTILRDTRIGLPFATGGTMHNLRLSQGGGPLGGSGNFRRGEFEGRWYSPLAELGGDAPGASPITFVFGLTAKAGWVWGDVGPHFRQLFSMGGVQFGIPLRGYEEFSITPDGIDPTAGTFNASSEGAFGGSYFAATTELGLRFSQSVYLSTFIDAGNVWDSPSRFNPSRLFRGSGFGLSLLTPLGPIGLDLAYGFDRIDVNGNPNPGWKFHFKIGNFF